MEIITAVSEDYCENLVEQCILSLLGSAWYPKTVGIIIITIIWSQEDQRRNHLLVLKTQALFDLVFF